MHTDVGRSISSNKIPYFTITAGETAIPGPVQLGSPWCKEGDGNDGSAQKIKTLMYKINLGATQLESHYPKTQG